MNVPTDISLQVVGSVAAALLVGLLTRRFQKPVEALRRGCLA